MLILCHYDTLEARKKQHQVEEESQAKLANMQLQNDVKLVKKTKKKFHQTITFDKEEKIQVISTNGRNGAPQEVNQYGG